jgi:hypothetical protein
MSSRSLVTAVALVIGGLNPQDHAPPAEAASLAKSLESVRSGVADAKRILLTLGELAQSLSQSHSADGTWAVDMFFLLNERLDRFKHCLGAAYLYENAACEADKFRLGIYVMQWAVNAAMTGSENAVQLQHVFDERWALNLANIHTPAVSQLGLDAKRVVDDLEKAVELLAKSVGTQIIESGHGEEEVILAAAALTTAAEGGEPPLK